MRSLQLLLLLVAFAHLLFPSLKQTKNWVEHHNSIAAQWQASTVSLSDCYMRVLSDDGKLAWAE